MDQAEFNMINLFFALMIENHCYLLQKGKETVGIQIDQEYEKGYKILSFSNYKTVNVILTKPEKISEFNCQE